MELIETPIFTKRIPGLLCDDEYRELQWAIVINPEAGTLIQGGGGIRKLRWRAVGKGKRGGIRVIYYWYCEEDKIYLLLAYLKSEIGDMTKEQLKFLSRYVKDGVL